MALSPKFKKWAYKLCVNATKLAAENAFNGDHFSFIGNKKSECDERDLLRILFQNLYT